MVKIKVQNENNASRFKRLATQRTKKVINALRVLEHCANRTSSDYDPADMRQIFSAIENEVKRVKLKFHTERKDEFRLV